MNGIAAVSCEDKCCFTFSRARYFPIRPSHLVNKYIFRSGNTWQLFFATLHATVQCRSRIEFWFCDVARNLLHRVPPPPQKKKNSLVARNLLHRVTPPQKKLSCCAQPIASCDTPKNLLLRATYCIVWHPQKSLVARNTIASCDIPKITCCAQPIASCDIPKTLVARNLLHRVTPPKLLLRATYCIVWHPQNSCCAQPIASCDIPKTLVAHNLLHRVTSPKLLLHATYCIVWHPPKNSLVARNLLHRVTPPPPKKKLSCCTQPIASCDIPKTLVARNLLHRVTPPKLLLRATYCIVWHPKTLVARNLLHRVTSPKLLLRATYCIVWHPQNSCCAQPIASYDTPKLLLRATYCIVWHPQKSLVARNLLHNKSFGVSYDAIGCAQQEIFGDVTRCNRLRATRDFWGCHTMQ